MPFAGKLGGSIAGFAGSAAWHSSNGEPIAPGEPEGLVRTVLHGSQTPPPSGDVAELIDGDEPGAHGG